MAIETRATQLAAILDFAKENGYKGNIDKVTKMLETLQEKTVTSEENVYYACKISEAMEKGKQYPNADIRNLGVKLPIGSRGRVEASKITAIMNAGIKEGYFKKGLFGSVTYYELV